MKKNKLLLVLIISIVANLILVVVLYIPQVMKLRVSRFKTAEDTSTISTATSKDTLFNEINPVDGFEIGATYGDLGPKMIAMGVIDPEKFKAIYEKSSQPLTLEQEGVLLKESNEKIKITRDNSYFLLNFFWAVGLANKSQILDDGDMMKYGGKKGAGNFASTGGWTLGKGDAMTYYSKSTLIPLTKEQEARVYLVASNIFRPCCNNSTAFPDCNHGMALLGVLQLMAGNDATESQMYEVGKYFNAFWFPGNYYDIALYFSNKEGKSFKDIDAQILLSKDYSSASGWQRVKQWLTDKGLIQQPPKKSGGCGV
ncbi:MAG: hypothetical protein UV74_C0013G0094 [Candidatus Woesebacteria bacterium GW2011_GWB1_43_14]|uniref:Uncharacterized protein n=1 Tax=Candidatus Woesebacteria bacterium GW2011_GWB1_43_14 TaxID=1618578 RepID=A0A0G1DHA3_9BACT|nr:MAG: hypothetical protein UV51_C0005G0130 [Candidatus Woesebacteria bacterium GW2011_GWC1_42_9]KKS96972.1 MAG: hypothetical protein UV74_C0013G0094 [Candidatus Woesebacteria bacterium GW2011_GWB1_43_14]